VAIEIDIGSIFGRADARDISVATVERLAASMGEVGLINPPLVREVAGGFELIAGAHRLGAAKRLGWKKVACEVVAHDDLRAELAMIDENLCRAELTPVDRARQTARRKAIYEELHPETQHGGDRKSDQVAKLATRSFSEDQASVTGVSERAVQRDAERGKKIADEALDLIRGTPLDKGSYLDEIKKLPVSEQLAIVRRDVAWQEQRAQAPAAKPEINGARALQATRKEPDDSLDYFPTPPWATRALLEAAPAIVLHGARVWEPACGEGHIAGVLQEFGAHVLSTDVFDYSVEGRSPPGWDRTVDFLSAVSSAAKADWIITNPPFGDRLLPFMLKALDRARDGVAMFVRSQSLETIERYTQLYAVRPPTAVMQFVERVPLHKGRWEPEGDTLTMYCWLVWQRGWLGGKPPGLETAYRWIPPGRREALSRPDDMDRFTAHPVLPFAGAVAPPKPHPTEPPAEPLPAFLGLAPFDFADFPEERLP